MNRPVRQPFEHLEATHILRPTQKEESPTKTANSRHDARAYLSGRVHGKVRQVRPTIRERGQICVLMSLLPLVSRSPHGKLVKIAAATLVFPAMGWSCVLAVRVLGPRRGCVHTTSKRRLLLLLTSTRGSSFSLAWSRRAAISQTLLLLLLLQPRVRRLCGAEDGKRDAGTLFPSRWPPPRPSPSSSAGLWRGI